MNGNGKPHPPEPIIAGWPEGVYPSDKPAEASGPNYLPLNLWYPGLKKVFNAPPIYICEHFLTDQECDDFIHTAAPLLQRSKTHAIAGTRHAKRGRRKVLRSTVAPPQHSPFCNSLCRARAGSEATKGRTSLTCHLAKKLPPSPRLLEKIQALTNKPFGHMELPQVARYTDSQRYVEHYDGVDPNTDAGRAFCANGGQRVATVLCYLNDVAEGGGTAFRCVRCILHACNSEKQRRRVRADIRAALPCFCVRTGASTLRFGQRRAMRSSSSQAL